MKFNIALFLFLFSSSSFASGWKSFEGTYKTSDTAGCHERLEVMYRPVGDVEALDIVFLVNDQAVAHESMTEGDFGNTDGGSSISYRVDNQFVGHYVSLLEISKANDLVKKLTLKVDRINNDVIESLDFSYQYLPKNISRKCLYIRKI